MAYTTITIISCDNIHLYIQPSFIIPHNTMVQHTCVTIVHWPRQHVLYTFARLKMKKAGAIGSKII